MSLWRGYGATNVICHHGFGRKAQILHVPRRWRKSKKKWQEPQTLRKREPSHQALRHFDESYRHQFGTAWPSIRLGLLSPQKYGALVNNYSIAEETEAYLQALGAEDFVQPAARALGEVTADRGVAEDSFTSDADSDSHSDSSDGDAVDQREVELPDPSTWSDSRMSGLQDSREPPDASPADKRPSWEDRYIVTPGYETRMEYLTSADARGGAPGLDLAHQAPPDLDVRRVQRPLAISGHLRCFIFEERRETSPKRFPPSKLDSRGFFLQYYALDAGSVLPVMALGIGPGDVVLDMCAAPGGKTLAVMQTMLTGGVVANEPETPRRRRLQNVLRTYLGVDRGSAEAVRVTAEDGRRWGEMEPDTYDKVLVDVPCTTDRLSATNNDNSIFAINRTKERWQLPQLQTDLLRAGLQAVKPGGDVVYSTCTLSQQQNDAVVQSALYQCQTENGVEAAVVDLSPLTQCLGHIFKFCEDGAVKHGQLVLPNMSNNFGPMYFCKLHRTR